MSAEEEAPNGTAYRESFARDGGLGTLRNEPMAGAEVVDLAWDIPVRAVFVPVYRYTVTGILVYR